MAYATVEDLESRWRSLDSDERARAGVLLEDVSVLIDEAAPPPAPPAEPTQHALSLRRLISCAAVKRAMAVSAATVGVSSEQHGTGPFQDSWNYANPMGDLYLLAPEIKRLRGDGRQRAATIPMYRTAGG